MSNWDDDERWPRKRRRTSAIHWIIWSLMSTMSVSSQQQLITTQLGAACHLPLVSLCSREKECFILVALYYTLISDTIWLMFEEERKFPKSFLSIYGIDSILHIATRWIEYYTTIAVAGTNHSTYISIISMGNQSVEISNWRPQILKLFLYMIEVWWENEWGQVFSITRFVCSIECTERVCIYIYIYILYMADQWFFDDDNIYQTIQCTSL